MSVTRSVFLGSGGYLPKRVVTNEELSESIDTSNDWIVERSGIRERRIAADGELTSDLAANAGAAALSAAELDPAELDLIIVATATPDLTFPATAAQVQAKLSAFNAIAFDQQAVCSGFMFALATADAFLRTGQAKTALVIGAETFSRILDWSDRATCVLFGDGAGAVVLGAAPGDGEPSDRGLLSVDLNTDGRLADILYVDGGPSSTKTVGHLRMQGREVFKRAVINLAATSVTAMRRAGVTADQVDWVVPHQANARIIDATVKKLGVPPEKVIVTVDRHANTSAASIPLALNEAIEDGRIRAGHLVLMEAMGGGLTWGGAVMRM